MIATSYDPLKHRLDVGVVVADPARPRNLCRVHLPLQRDGHATESTPTPSGINRIQALVVSGWSVRAVPRHTSTQQQNREHTSISGRKNPPRSGVAFHE